MYRKKKGLSYVGIHFFCQQNIISAQNVKRAVNKDVIELPLQIGCIDGQSQVSSYMHTNYQCAGGFGDLLQGANSNIQLQNKCTSFSIQKIFSQDDTSINK